MGRVAVRHLQSLRRWELSIRRSGSSVVRGNSTPEVDLSRLRRKETRNTIAQRYAAYDLAAITAVDGTARLAAHEVALALMRLHPAMYA